jgi:glycine dehydrogenase subunit 2
MIAIATEAKEDGKSFKEAPYTMPVRRLDDVKAARHPDLKYQPDAS